MNRLAVVLCGILIFLSVGAAQAAQTLVGPTPSSDLKGWNDSGLKITALDDVTLESFYFHNQGLSDTISFKSMGGDFGRI